MVACAVALVLALVVATVPHLLYNYFRLKSIPGPICGAFSDFWRVNAQRSPGYGPRLAEVHQGYGNIVRLGPRLVSLSNARAIAGAYRRRILDELSQHDYQDQLPDHQEVSRYDDAIDDAVRKILRIQRHRTIDLTLSLRFFADEFVARFFSSTHPAESNDRSRTKPSSSFFTTIEEMLLRGPVHLLKRDRFSCYIPSSDISASADRHDHVLPRESYKDTKHASNELSVIGAGIECITNTFVSVFFFLLNHPHSLQKLRLEIDNMPRCWDRPALPYARDFIGISFLDAVLKETMRLVLLRSHPKGIQFATAPLDILSLRIPRGTTVSWHPYVLLTDASIYGDDPEIFRPERWLTADRRRRDLMEEPLLPFTVCMDHYPKLAAAWLQLRKAVVVLLQGFGDLRLLQTADPNGDSGDSGAPYPPSMFVEFRPRIPMDRGYFGELM